MRVWKEVIILLILENNRFDKALLKTFIILIYLREKVEFEFS